MNTLRGLFRGRPQRRIARALYGGRYHEVRAALEGGDYFKGMRFCPDDFQDLPEFARRNAKDNETLLCVAARLVPGEENWQDIMGLVLDAIDKTEPETLVAHHGLDEDDEVGPMLMQRGILHTDDTAAHASDYLIRIHLHANAKDKVARVLDRLRPYDLRELVRGVLPAARAPLWMWEGILERAAPHLSACATRDMARKMLSSHRVDVVEAMVKLIGVECVPQDHPGLPDHLRVQVGAVPRTVALDAVRARVAPDVTLVLSDGDSLGVHKLLLKAVSEYWATHDTTLVGTSGTLDVTHLPAEAVRAFVDQLYGVEDALEHCTSEEHTEGLHRLYDEWLVGEEMAGPARKRQRRA